MMEDGSNWFPRWEEQLPSYEELMPLNQTLITPNLALAFDIPNPSNYNNYSNTPQTPPPPPTPNNTSPLTPSLPNSAEFDNSAELGSGDEPARTLKRPRLVWTPQLHKRFVDAVAHLGIKNAVPKTIMQLMSVDGLTRENVASHLQKYRLYLKRMQGFGGGGGGGGSNGGLGSSDPATDRLFASSPVPAHFLHPGRPNSDHFLPFVQPPNAGGGAIWVAPHPQLQYPQQQQQRQVGQFGSPPNGQFELPFVARQQSQAAAAHRIGAPVHNSSTAAYVEDLDGGRKVLTLFPTGND